jgi:hypothetical protein
MDRHARETAAKLDEHDSVLTGHQAEIETLVINVRGLHVWAFSLTVLSIPRLAHNAQELVIEGDASLLVRHTPILIDGQTLVYLQSLVQL